MQGYPRVTMAEIRRLYDSGEGRHWFDRKTLQFFGTKLPRTGVHAPFGNYFITSELSIRGDDPRYTLRVQRPKARGINKVGGFWDINTVGEFRAYPNKDSARAALKRLLAAERVRTAAQPHPEGVS